MLQTSTEAPWPLQQCCKRQPKLRGFCNGVANVNRNSVAFATMLQTSTETPRPLQQCCKRQPKLRGFCNNVANVNRNSVAFATVLQTSTETPWPLQRCCKRQPKLRGLCNNVANVNRNSVAFATALQTSTDRLLGCMRFVPTPAGREQAALFGLRQKIRRPPESFVKAESERSTGLLQKRQKERRFRQITLIRPLVMRK